VSILVAMETWIAADVGVICRATRGVSRRATGTRSRKKMTPISDEESDESADEPNLDGSVEQIDIESAAPSRRQPARKSARQKKVVETSESEETEDEESEEDETE